MGITASHQEAQHHYRIEQKSRDILPFLEDLPSQIAKFCQTLLKIFLNICKLLAVMLGTTPNLLGNFYETTGYL
ncbi:hypothetical protein [Calothrix sp. 336/3]|uniref:hypothetical protein n=1 Tax=Calothrix sp. 336/3 TaxID=1337936 RepID=UPI0004E2C1D8|nr:hypothetical protein [Calothrix sp. 336/3]AKG19944.1 hypothetical protein IJ00_00195 [Calothrix sp. 336/3]